MLIFATDSETSRHRWLPVLATGEWAVATVADWPGLVQRTVSAEAEVVVVDPALVGLRAGVLVELAASLPHRPLLRSIDAPLPGVPLLPSRPSALHTLLHRRLAKGARSELAERLAWSGLGADGGRRLAVAAAAEGVVIIEGPRGTGKEQHARLVHTLWRRGAPFLVVGAEAVPPLDGGPGTVYFEAAHRLTDLADRVREVERAGWRVMLGTRRPVAHTGATRLRLLPLHDRPESIAPLALHFLDLHARRLGLPRRRLDRRLLGVLQAWSWPNNERELDRFVHDVLVAVDRPLIRADALPPDLAARLDPSTPAQGVDLEGFEELVATRLAPVVQGWHPGAGPALHPLVTDSTQRALLRLVLARTGGNQKAAAALLGVARNTLHSHMIRLGVVGGAAAD